MKPPAPARKIARWLFLCSALVFAMVLLGGLTRLTESGLSMVTWKPVTGWLPPLGNRDWAALFDAYRETPEFRRLNFWMTVEDFKRIFWLEYLHRLLGRIVGLVYALPLFWFAVRYRLPGRLAARLVFLLGLGAAQGALGWYMVKSGLVDRPSVSQYRLAAHLGLAVAIYGMLLHTALGLRARRPSGGRAAAPVAALTFVTMIWGAFLAGLDGGSAYNTFPLMEGRLLPPEATAMSPIWRNLFENVAAVQFLHRALAVFTVLAALAAWYWNRTGVFAVMAAFAVAQFALGAATILTGAPIALAWMHQAGAMLLFSSAIWAWRRGRLDGLRLSG